MQASLVSALSKAGLLNLAQQASIAKETESLGIELPEALTRLGLFSPQELSETLGNIFGLRVVCVNNYDYHSICSQLNQRELITLHGALPLTCSSTTLLLAVSDPTNLQVEEDFRFATGLQVELVLADWSILQSSIRKVYGKALSQEQANPRDINQDELINLVELDDNELDTIEDLSQDGSPVSRYINQILLDAVRKGASDIHFEPYENIYRVRLRCDGILMEVQQPPSHLSRRLSARLKILSKLDIAERRLPQDGRIKLKLNSDTAIDMRVSTLPTLFGEKIVLRLLDNSSSSLAIECLGYSESQKQAYLQALKRPQGMILMTGPTGSGKTVSLYAGLNILNQPEVNISTAEDPVEINLLGINQVQIQPKIGFTFAEALRSFLRQDPDIVMVGEIRDVETAEIAMKASQTGHLVLSTLHTNSAAETVTRLSNMGISNYNLSSSLSLVIAQRLARKLCNNCKQIANHSDKPLLELGITDEVIYQANTKGCSECNNGYLGRTGIYEVMIFDEPLIQAVANGVSSSQLEKLAVENGMHTLKMSGIEKLKQGITSLNELQRVLFL
ncbi:type IV-A pilus assembly ATPase PilB [Vibrio rotiferianus]|uniref:type IV-A pilus assembly ATPase PilB n=1 Tax=Vibrio rotiferianus TaxID=190895 RepID=UPI00406AA352